MYVKCMDICFIFLVDFNVLEIKCKNFLSLLWFLTKPQGDEEENINFWGGTGSQKKMRDLFSKYGH